MTTNAGHNGAEENRGTASSRRGFLRGLGAAGGAALAGLGAFGLGAKQADAQLKVGTSRPKSVSKLSTKSKLGTKSLSLSKSPTLQRISAPAAAGQETLRLPTRPAAKPSPRGRLVRVLQTYEPADGGGRGQIPTVPDGAFGGMTRALTLAEAYQAGITLTTTGCEYAGGTYTGDDPIYYGTDRGRFFPTQMREHRLIMSPGRQGRGGTRLLWIHMTTPGSTTQRAAYILELCLASEVADYMDDLRIKLNGESLDLTGTSEGTWLAVVELPGSGDRRHELEFSLRRDSSFYSFEFCWLNVIAR